MLEQITLRAPATVANLGPGYDIFAMSLLSPFDILKLSLNDSGVITLSCSGRDEGLPKTVQDNAAGIAAEHFMNTLDLRTGLHIEIKKRMQSASGLGTSGASSAACVYGLDKLLNTGLSPIEIIDIARQGETATGGVAHADNVAGCLLGGFILIKSYTPLAVERLEIPEIPVVISVMKKPQKTTRSLIPDSLGLKETKEQMSGCASLVHAVMAGDLKKIGEAINTDHISEPVRSRYIPGYNDVKNAVLETGAYGCNVSGGGSSVFVICEEGLTGKVAETLTAFSSHGMDSEVLVTRAGNRGVEEIDDTQTEL